MAGPLPALTGSLKVQAQWTAATIAASTNYQATQNANTITKNLPFTLGTTALNKCNQIYSQITSIASSGSHTFDLSAAFTNVLGNAAATFARIKGFVFQVLSVADDAVNGTACSGVIIGNAGGNDVLLAVSAQPGLDEVASTFQMGNGDVWAFFSAGANGIVIDSTHKSLKVANNDGAIACAFQMTIYGADA